MDRYGVPDFIDYEMQAMRDPEPLRKALREINHSPHFREGWPQMRVPEYRWEITESPICNMTGLDSRVGDTGPHNSDPSIDSDRSEFELYDDDGVPYFKGLIWGEYIGDELLHDIGYGYGAVHVKLNGEWL